MSLITHKIFHNSGTKYINMKLGIEIIDSIKKTHSNGMTTTYDVIIRLSAFYPIHGRQDFGKAQYSFIKPLILTHNFSTNYF